MATPPTSNSKLQWLGTPWTFLVLGILTWPLYIAVLALCVRFHLSVWIANIAAFILIFGGFAFSGCTVLAAWHRTPSQRLLILCGSLAAWFAAGRILYIWFGHLVREVAR
jgi:cation transport ATPase